jgi:hypothetical protein
MSTLPSLEYVIGDSVPIRVSLVDLVTLEAYDLTGALDAWFTLKELPADADADAVLAYRLGTGITITAPTSGYVEIFPVAASTAELVDGYTYQGDVRVKTAGGFILTTLFTLTARRQITISAA